MFTAEQGLSRLAEACVPSAGPQWCTLGSLGPGLSEEIHSESRPQLACSDVVRLSPVIMAITRTLGLTPASLMPSVDT